MQKALFESFNSFPHPPNINLVEPIFDAFFPSAFFNQQIHMPLHPPNILNKIHKPWNVNPSSTLLHSHFFSFPQSLHNSKSLSSSRAPFIFICIVLNAHKHLHSSAFPTSTSLFFCLLFFFDTFKKYNFELIKILSAMFVLHLNNKRRSFVYLFFPPCYRMNELGLPI